MLDQDLLKELVKRKLLDENQAKRILNDADLTRKSAEELLYESRFLDELAVARVKSELIGAPF
ncbi:MAG: hypothetical protein QMD65_03215, partial [Patescibacteria group bacterium]|nr:hypothetical protein [Patescibacteria group bacterium]